MPLPLRADGPPRQNAEMVEYVIVVTGTELLAGAYADAHTVFLTRALHPRGLRCVAAIIVDDSQEEIETAVRQALGRAKLVIVTGGLGPTEDDVTRQALSAVTGIAIREHPGLSATIALRFNTPVDQLRANLRRQTQVPVRGGYLDNPNGTAAGLIFETDDGYIVALPGPPRELQPMVHERLLPYLAEKFGTRTAGELLRVRFVGIGESAVSDTIDQRVPIPDGVTVGSLFEGMRVDFYFSLPGSTAEDLVRLDTLKQEILAELGDYVYATGNTSLESHVVELFAARRQTLAVAEIGSGGSLAAGLNGAEAAADVLRGAYTAPTETLLRRMLDLPAEPDAPGAAAAGERLAGRLAERTGADWSMYIGPIREAGGGSHVEVTIRQPDGRAESRSLSTRGASDLARSNLTTQLLDLLRRRLRP